MLEVQGKPLFLLYNTNEKQGVLLSIPLEYGSLCFRLICI